MSKDLSAVMWSSVAQKLVVWLRLAKKNVHSKKRVEAQIPTFQDCCGSCLRPPCYYDSPVAWTNWMINSINVVGSWADTTRLVVWNMLYTFPYIGNVIIPTDESIFFRDPWGGHLWTSRRNLIHPSPCSQQPARRRVRFFWCTLRFHQTWLAGHPLVSMGGSS